MKNIKRLVEHLQKITNKKIILVENDDFDIDKIDIDTSGVFIPRRFESRKKETLREILKSLKIIKSYSDGSVDVDGHVKLSGLNLTKIPIKFNKVYGYFECNDNQLTTLENCPKEVTYWFDCSFNNLTSLRGCPKHIESSLFCQHNQLTSLEGCPEKINGSLFCSSNKITSLKGFPKEVDDLSLENNPRSFTEEEVRDICNVRGTLIL